MRSEIIEHDSLGEAVRAFICREIEQAVAACTARQSGTGSLVWETRKHLKRARAALRLLRQDVPRNAFGKENRRLREVGRLMSDIRDAEVRLGTVREMRDAFGVDRIRNYEKTEDMLAFDLDNFLAAFEGWETEAAEELRRAQQSIGQWQLHDVPPSRILRALRKSYKSGRDAVRRVKKKGTAPRFHELRKRSKTLWYQLGLLDRLDRQRFCDLRRPLKAIGVNLGHAHDLCFVVERLESLTGRHGRDSRRNALDVLIKSRECDLQRKALRRGERFYADKPREFMRRLASEPGSILSPDDPEVVMPPVALVLRETNKVSARMR